MNTVLVTQFFDSLWYIRCYPDVAAAGVDPLQHYLTFGKKEGRWPCALPALELEQELWKAAKPEPFLGQLQQLFAEQQSLHSALAAWVLARWYGSLGQWQQVAPLLQRLLDDEAALSIIAHQGPFLLAFATYLNCQQPTQANTVLAHPLWLDTHDKQLARSMLLNGKAKLQVLNQIFAAHNLTPLRLNTQADLDQLKAVTKPAWYQWFAKLGRLQPPLLPKVTVIMPCFNAAKTIATALNSLLLQSHHKIEVLVADDCSTDNSAAIVNHIAARDSRVKLLSLTQNSGAYVARNTALQQASGDIITTHDADDWSHPQKIAQQVEVLMQQPEVMATVSHWVRCSPDLQFQRWRAEDAWIYRNVSSLMFRRKVFETLGFWDCVSVNADTEYYYRIKQQFGQPSIVEVLPGVPLSFGRADEGSLSQIKASHLRTQFRGLRKDYHDAAMAWQQSGESLYLEASPSHRPFVVPPLMCRGNELQQKHNLLLAIMHKRCFDTAWYCRRYPDIVAAGVDPLAHFVEYGAKEGRDPLPIFSLTGYAYARGVSPIMGLQQWLSDSDPITGPQVVAGSRALQQPAPTLLIVGHAVSNSVFGAERSLLDVVKALSQGAFNLVVALPAATAADYIAAIQAYVSDIVFMPYMWWQGGRQEEPLLVEMFSDVIKQFNIKLLYVNTLVLAEPFSAARKLAVPAIMHVRELPSFDPALCRVLAASAEQIHASVVKRADFFIANSTVVANWLAVPERTAVVPNLIDIAAWPLAPLPGKARLQVAMLSSNLPKKGLADVIAVANGCEQQQIPADFVLYGPLNKYVKHYSAAGLPANVHFAGYAAEPQQAIAAADVILNLSHFQESFGRSVLEGMAAGRAVIAYNWGALPELITDGCGILVPFKDTAAVVKALGDLAANRSELQALGMKARARAAAHYAPQHVAAKLTAVIQQLLPVH